MNMSKLLGQVRDTIQDQYQSIPAAEEYVGWIRRYLFFNNRRHPAIMGEIEVRRFLDHLEVSGRVSNSMQNQAFCALNFFYREVLGRELALVPTSSCRGRDVNFLIGH